MMILMSMTIFNFHEIDLITWLWQCHRVMIPDDETKRRQMRRSMAFFVTTDHDVTVRCLDGSDKYPPINATEYLYARLNATHLY